MTVSLLFLGGEGYLVSGSRRLPCLSAILEACLLIASVALHSSFCGDDTSIHLLDLCLDRLSTYVKPDER